MREVKIQFMIEQGAGRTGTISTTVPMTEAEYDALRLDLQLREGAYLQQWIERNLFYAISPVLVNSEPWKVVSPLI
jgi:hypothetical protein